VASFASTLILFSGDLSRDCEFPPSCLLFPLAFGLVGGVPPGEDSDVFVSDSVFMSCVSAVSVVDTSVGM
jgi:hypothetical protein